MVLVARRGGPPYVRSVIRLAHGRGFFLVVVLAGCNGPAGTGSGTEACAGVFQYHGVCFHAHAVEPMGYRHPLQLDGEPGHELVSVAINERVAVHRFDGKDFVLVGEAEAPATVIAFLDVIAGEFDELPGRDLVVSEHGEWAALYHLDEHGAPTLAGQTAFAGNNSEAMGEPVAVGPDANGRWRIVAHHENGQESASPDPLSLWEVQGTTFVEVERIDLPTGACELYACASGKFNGDGRTDAVCTIEDVCSNDPPKNYVVNVVLLAQPDGTVATTAYPSTVGGAFATDLDGDGITDLAGDGALDTVWYLLGDGTGGLEPVTWLDLPAPPTLDWDIVSVGDLDGNGDAEMILGDHSHALVFDDVVGAPEIYEPFEVNDRGLDFGIYMDVTMDVNADNIVDLPMYDRMLLVSELRQ
jgi:hypothetical protein